MDAAVSARFRQSKGIGVSPAQKGSHSFAGGGRGKGGKGQNK